MHPGIVVLGAGHAGVRAAFSARQSGYQGPISIVAAEGVEGPYERPKLSKWDERGPTKSLLYSDTAYGEANIELLSGRAVSLELDRNQLTLDTGPQIPFSRLLLATGASARSFSLTGSETSNVRYLRSFSDAKEIHSDCQAAESVAIIGAGLIGLELAATLRRMGVKVTVVESESRPLKRAVAASVAQVIERSHIENGVEFRFDARIDRVNIPGHIKLTDGTIIPADVVIASIGSTPNTKIAAEAGLAVKAGIAVDRYLRTSHSDVYAAGDCCSFPLYGNSETPSRLESWNAAGEQGDIAGWNMVNSDQRKPCDIVPYFWSKQYEHTIQVAGIANTTLTTVERVFDSHTRISIGLNSDGQLAYACGVGSGSTVSREIRFAMKLIAKKIQIDEETLSRSDRSLRSIWKEFGASTEGSVSHVHGLV